MLTELRVAKPCPESWSGMDGDDRVKFCGRCKHNVFNISELSQVEAAELIERHEGRLCVRFYQRADGKVMTRDCKVGLVEGRRRLAKLASVTAGFMLTAFCVAYAAALPKRHAMTPERLLAKGRSAPVVGPLITKIAPPPPTAVVGFISVRSVPPATGHP